MSPTSSGTRGAGLVLAVAVAVCAGLTGNAAAQGPGVLVVGDSVDVGTGPHLRRELGSTPVTIDAKESRPSSVGLAVLSRLLRPGHRVVVFDLGVNDDPSQPAPLARNLAAARKMVGDRCLVVATLSRPPVNGASIGGLNRVVRAFVADTPGAQLLDWHAATRSDRTLLAPDGVHAGPTGYAARARLLAGAIEGCLDPSAPADEDASPLREPPPEPRSEPRRTPAPHDPAWVDLVRRLQYGPVAALWQAALDRLDAAVRDFVGALSPPRPEPKLGEAAAPRASGENRR